jgi:hypothetical protein
MGVLLAPPDRDPFALICNAHYRTATSTAPETVDFFH